MADTKQLLFMFYEKHILRTDHLWDLGPVSQQTRGVGPMLG